MSEENPSCAIGTKPSADNDIDFEFDDDFDDDDDDDDELPQELEAFQLRRRWETR